VTWSWLSTALAFASARFFDTPYYITPNEPVVAFAVIREAMRGKGVAARSFKGIISDDISEFESYMPSQAVEAAERSETETQSLLSGRRGR
jgi:hypothetical protein